MAEVHRRDRLLSTVGWLHVALAAVTVALMLLDGRQITGVNAWLKPFKFSVSITAYTWTVAWFLEYLRHRPRWVRALSVGVSICMVVEIVCIVLQAARGTTSHYNDSSLFDTTVLSTMGTLIALNTVLAVLLLTLLFRPGIELPSLYLWGLRVGVVVFLLGSAAGGQMIANRSHAIGVPDGGPGLPLVNWSLEGGDLRIAHALGLHALQVLPFAAWVVERRRGSAGLFWAFTAVYVLLLGLLYGQAMAGRPILG